LLQVWPPADDWLLLVASLLENDELFILVAVGVSCLFCFYFISYCLSMTLFSSTIRYPHFSYICSPRISPFFHWIRMKKCGICDYQYWGVCTSRCSQFKCKEIYMSILIVMYVFIYKHFCMICICNNIMKSFQCLQL
jgi:hypothetical protein